ncbi:hypothetical protein [Acrocarpospora sp. B8E8]|uniref:hypothetical protein n=1 Tax=Acrocarpospora sp. B8E8 TaxID=3153572 RepID=UPI00325CBCBB
MTRGSREVDELIRQAKRDGLKAERVGYRWEVSNPAKPGAPLSIPASGVGHSLSAVRRELRLLAEKPNPMVAAVSGLPTERDLTERALSDWDLGSLLIAAERQEISIRVRNGLLEVSGPPESEPLARLLRDRAGEVLAHLNPPNPPTQEVDDVARVRDVAKISRPAEDLARDAQALFEIVREKAAEQNDRYGNNAGIDGVLWDGALTKVMDEFASWDAEYRRQVAGYLERTRHTKCQRKDASPPVWWVANAWNDGGLKVTRMAVQPSGEVSDEQLLALLAARLRQDPGSAERIAELETANAALRSRIEDLTAQIAEKDRRLAQYDAAAAIFRNGA